MALERHRRRRGQKRGDATLPRILAAPLDDPTHCELVRVAQVPVKAVSVRFLPVPNRLDFAAVLIHGSAILEAENLGELKLGRRVRRATRAHGQPVTLELRDSRIDVSVTRRGRALEL